MARADETTDINDTEDESPMDAFDADFDDAAQAALVDDGTDDDAIETDEPGEDEVEAGTETLDDDEPSSEGESVADGVDRGDGRDVKGKFVPKAGDEPATDAKPATDDAAAKALAGTTPATAAAAPTTAATPSPEPAWEPYTVKADRQQVPLEGVMVTRANGHALIALPEAELGRFNARIARGHIAEQVWRQLQTEKQEFELQKSAPQPKSDLEIEAEVTLEAIKPYLTDLLDATQLENLELKVKVAQSNYRAQFDTDERTRREQATAETRTTEQAEAERGTQLEGLATEILNLLEHVPELKSLGFTPDEVKAVYADLAPVVRGVYWREGDGWFVNRDAIVAKLRAHAALRTKAPGTSAAPAPGTAASATTAAPGTGGTGTSHAERFNKGQASAAVPGSTSLKAKRGAPSDTRPQLATAGARNTRDDEPSPALKAEENWRKKTRAFLNSNSLDFPDDDEDEG